MPGITGVDAMLLTTQKIVLRPGSWEGKGYRSSYWRLYFHDGPGVVVRCRGVEHALLGGRAFLIPSGLTFDYFCTREVRHLFIHFDLPGIPSATVEGILGTPIELPEDPVLSGIMGRLWDHMDDGEADSGMAHTAWLSLASVYTALSVFAGNMPPGYVALLSPMSPGMKPILPALRIISLSFSDRLHITGLAAACGMSREHFTRRFKGIMGITPVDYIRDFRIKTAEGWLIYSDKGIEQIAEESGFGSREYFTRVFTGRMGCSPGVYRANAPYPIAAPTQAQSLDGIRGITGGDDGSHT